MSRTDGHRTTCRGNCWGCETGVWRRLANTQRRRNGRALAEEQYELVTDGGSEVYDPETDCPHGRSGTQADWCSDCHPCPGCGTWHGHVADCWLRTERPLVWTTETPPPEGTPL